MQQAIALAVILGIAGGLTGAWLLQREDDRRAVLAIAKRAERAPPTAASLRPRRRPEPLRSRHAVSSRR